MPQWLAHRVGAGSPVDWFNELIKFLYLFRGQRIVYELSLQEVFLAYSGYGGTPSCMLNKRNFPCVIPTGFLSVLRSLLKRLMALSGDMLRDC